MYGIYVYYTRLSNQLQLVAYKQGIWSNIPVKISNDIAVIHAELLSENVNTRNVFIQKFAYNSVGKILVLYLLINLNLKFFYRLYCYTTVQGLGVWRQHSNNLTQPHFEGAQPVTIQLPVVPLLSLVHVFHSSICFSRIILF